MEPYALEIRAGAGRPRAGGGLVVCTQGSPACQNPTQNHCQAGYKGVLARILHGPPRVGGAGCIGQTMPAPQWPLCVRFPQEERKEPSPVPASCWAGITTGGHRCPSHISGAQWGPDLTAEGRQGSRGWARGPVLVIGPQSSRQERPGELGRRQGLGRGGHSSPSDVAAAASHLLPALRARASRGLAGVRRRGLGPRPPLPVSAAPTPAQDALSCGGR